MLGKNVISWIALVASIVAILMSSTAMMKQAKIPAINEGKAASLVYDQLVTEVTHDLEPIYADMGMKMPDKVSSISDLIRPLIYVDHAITDSSGSD